MPSQKIFLLFAVVFLPAALRLPAEIKPNSTSTSRQFIVYGADTPVRGAMCALAEATKANLLRLLQLQDNWKVPLLINLDYPQANFPESPARRLDFSQTGFGLKLQLNLLVTSDLNGPAVQRELLRAILLEMIYRTRTNVPAGTPYVEPPDWLVDGILQSAPGHNADETARLLQPMVAAKQITPLEEIARQRRELLDPEWRKIYDAYSAALVQLLLDAPGGPGKLAKFISDLPDSPNDPMADLQTHFPEVLGKSSARWWSLSVARLAAADRYETLSAAETAARLDRLLKFSIPDRSGATTSYTLNDYSFLELPVSRSTLRQRSRQLLLLASQAHPSYRPIVQEYHQIAEWLASGRNEKVRERLVKVAADRRRVARQVRQIDDYMNWFEATQLTTMSGTFLPYLNAASAGDETGSHRHDPISVYLDSIEMQTQ